MLPENNQQHVTVGAYTVRLALYRKPYESAIKFLNS